MDLTLRSTKGSALTFVEMDDNLSGLADGTKWGTIAGAQTFAGAVTLQSTLTLAGYSSVVGVWTTPTFAAGDYTGNGSMTWTVQAGDVVTMAYTIVNKLMTVNFYIASTSVGGTPNTLLQIAIPAAKVATKDVLTTIAYIDNGGTQTIGICSVPASGTVIRCLKADGVSNWIASTNTTSVYGSITFEIN